MSATFDGAYLFSIFTHAPESLLSLHDDIHQLVRHDDDLHDLLALRKACSFSSA